MNILAIIPARGGSKRIPRKNIKDFLGKPIISYSIQAAIDTGLFNEIMVSTEDKEIAEISMIYGASVPFYRSESNSNDFATTFDVIEEVTLEYKKNGKEYAISCSWENRAKEWNCLLGLNKNKWIFYCSLNFEEKMIQQYINNLNNT